MNVVYCWKGRRESAVRKERSFWRGERQRRGILLSVSLADWDELRGWRGWRAAHAEGQRTIVNILHYLHVTLDGTETIPLTILMKTLASSPSAEYASCHQRGLVGSKTSLQRNPPVFDSGCWLMQVVCLSALRCKWFAYGPADATATPSSLASLKTRMLIPFWCQLTQVVVEKRPLNGCLICHF